MTYPKLLGIITLLLFATIAVMGFFKGSKASATKQAKMEAAPLEVELEQEVRVAAAAPIPQPAAAVTKPAQTVKKEAAPEPLTGTLAAQPENILANLPDANRIQELFNKGDPKLPIVETITYKSRVPWQKGRPAWLSDYASYYATSRHFIARSLNGKPDYFKQDVAEGDRFNVLKKGVNINFHLVIDVSRSRMWLYYLDLDKNERVLLKTYPVGLGRVDKTKGSGLLTPLGKYSLGDKIAIYKPKMQGFHNGQKVEMIRIFGSRWIPFDKEISGCTLPAKGFGIHGVPWVQGSNGTLAQDTSSLGKYESDGCIRLSTEDVEELFAIIITRPTIVELVKDFREAKLPGVERTVVENK